MDYSINLDGVSHPILCGFCRAPIGDRAEGGGDGKQIGCVACDNWGDPDEVGKLAAEFVKDDYQLAFNRMARDVAKNSKVMKFTGDTAHKRTHRFIADLKV